MKFNETQPGCWYRRICDGQILMPLVGKNRFVTPAGNWHNEVPEGDFIRCNQDGNPYVPAPAVGQVWRDSFGKVFRINKTKTPNESPAYVAVRDNGYCEGSPNITDLVKDCTFLCDK